MSFSLPRFGLQEMLRCGRDLHTIADAAGSLEDAAREVVRYFYDQSRDEAGNRECLLARFYKSHPYGDLAPELQTFARRLLGAQPPSEKMQCLTLLATAGDRPEWNEREGSRAHQAIPLASVEVVEDAPMIAELIRAMGIDVRMVVHPDAELIRGAQGKKFNVFYVPAAKGNPHIPAQDFVQQYSVGSVLGFGGLLVTGAFYAVVLFTRVTVPPESADRFRNVSLDLKLALSAAGLDATFGAEAAQRAHQPA